MVDREMLHTHYAINSTLMLHYKYSLEELENMIPMERDVYITFIEKYVKEKQEMMKRHGHKSGNYFGG